MSGHSKWSSIKHQKGAKDVQRGALFTKLAREITVSVKTGGSGDLNANFRLRLAVEKARANNMPNDNVQRAISSALGGGEATNYDEVLYEGFGPGGSAVLVQALTDNRNRTVSEVRNAFTKGGGNMGESGSVGWMFENRGVITLDVANGDPDDAALMAIEAGAEDVGPAEDGAMEVLTAPGDLKAVEDALRAAALTITESALRFVPTTSMELPDTDTVRTLRMIERLEELDDVQIVFTNVEINDAVIAQLA